jgi:hypothetical protein
MAVQLQANTGVKESTELPSAGVSNSTIIGVGGAHPKTNRKRATTKRVTRVFMPNLLRNYDLAATELTNDPIRLA